MKRLKNLRLKIYLDGDKSYRLTSLKRRLFRISLYLSALFLLIAGISSKSLIISLLLVFSALFVVCSILLYEGRLDQYLFRLFYKKR